MKIDSNKFRIILARNQMNTRELSERSGISTNTINSWLKSVGRRNPNTKHLGIVADVLKVDVTELLED